MEARGDADGKQISGGGVEGGKFPAIGKADGVGGGGEEGAIEIEAGVIAEGDAVGVEEEEVGGVGGGDRPIN